MNTITLCHETDISEGESKGFQFDDTSLFAIKKNEAIFLYKNSCPHLGIELEWIEDQFLDTDANLIQCSTHGALFLIESGECVAGPCQGQHLQSLAYTTNDHGELLITL
ncbi:MAG: Rieske 2Fe-2S domain-containing protein [Sinobacterium sp.]|nr:Rieske 2Fe-2S domain-containing protein [Sinobacterium sp.]